MKKVTYVLAIALLAGVSQAASLKQGTREVVVEGALDPDSYAGTQLDLNVGYGYFLQDNIEVGGEVGFSDNDLVTIFGLSGFGEYNFDQGGPLVPFVGASLGWFNVEVDDLDADDDALVLGGRAGVKYFLAENVAISAQLNLDVASEDIYVNDDEVEDTDMTITVGMRFFLP